MPKIQHPLGPSALGPFLAGQSTQHLVAAWAATCGCVLLTQLLCKPSVSCACCSGDLRCDAQVLGQWLKKELK